MMNANFIDRDELGGDGCMHSARECTYMLNAETDEIHKGFATKTPMQMTSLSRSTEQIH